MAAAVATPTITLTDITQKMERVFGSIAINANPATYTTGGIACSFSGQDSVKSSKPPRIVRVISSPPAASPATATFVYQFNPGTTQANGKLQVFTGAAAQSGLTELSAGAIPSGVSGDTIAFVAEFDRV